MNTKSLEERIRAAMIETYWEGISTDISNNNFDSTVQIITEIRDRICMFAPSRNDLHHNIHENIDIDYIEQMIKHNAISGEYIYTIVNYIITQIKTFGTIQDEMWNEVWREQINKRLQENEELKTVFPIFFSECFKRIEMIEEGIRLFKESNIYKELKRKHEESVEN